MLSERARRCVKHEHPPEPLIFKGENKQYKQVVCFDEFYGDW